MIIDLTSTELEQYALLRLHSSPLHPPKVDQKIVEIIEGRIKQALDQADIFLFHNFQPTELTVTINDGIDIHANTKS